MRGGMLLALLAIATAVAVASADDVTNNIDGSADAVIETMPLTVGGPDGSTDLSIIAVTGDGGPVNNKGVEQACNLPAGGALVLNVAVSDPSVATVSPSQITFQNCSSPKTVTVHPGATGTAHVTFTQSSYDGQGTITTGFAAFDVVVAESHVNTAPTLAITGVAPGQEFDVDSAIPPVMCNITDDGGNSSFAATLSPDLDDDGVGVVTASCDYTDGGGLHVAGSIMYLIVDPSEPVITADVNPDEPDGLSGWYIGDVTLNWSVEDPQSPHSLVPSSGCDPVSITLDQGPTDYTCSATSSGGTATQTVTIKRDAAHPQFACPPGPSDWVAHDVSLDCTASDTTSGLDDASPDSFTLSTSVGDGNEDAAASTGTQLLTDNAGNAVTAGPFAFMVDRKAPGLTCGAADGIWHPDNVAIGCSGSDGGAGFGDDGATTTELSVSTHVDPGSETANALTDAPSVTDNVGHTTTGDAIGGNMVDRKAPVVTITCPTGDVIKGSSASAAWTAHDGGSGPGAAGGTISLDTGSVGPQTATIGAQVDNVGNASAPASCSYTVVYKFSGFFQPVDNKGTDGNFILNKTKAGSTVPIKFNLGGNQGLAIMAAGYPASGTIDCGALASDTVEETTTATVSGLKYDAAADQYIYNWKTDPKWAGSCRQLVVELADGTVHRADFQLTK